MYDLFLTWSDINYCPFLSYRNPDDDPKRPNWFKGTLSSVPPRSMECALYQYCHYLQNDVALSDQFKAAGGMLTRSFIVDKGICFNSINTGTNGGFKENSIPRLLDNNLYLKKDLNENDLADETFNWPLFCPKEYLFSTFFKRFKETESNSVSYYDYGEEKDITMVVKGANDFVHQYRQSSMNESWFEINGDKPCPYGENRPKKLPRVMTEKKVWDKTCQMLQTIHQEKTQAKLKRYLTTEANQTEEEATATIERLHALVKDDWKVSYKFKFSSDNREKLETCQEPAVQSAYGFSKKEWNDTDNRSETRRTAKLERHKTAEENLTPGTKKRKTKQNQGC